MADLAPMTKPPTLPNLLGDAVLIVDDEPAICSMLARVVSLVNGTPVTAATAAEAQKAVKAQTFACAIIDKNLGEDDGVELLRWIRKEQPGCETVIVTAYGNIQSSIEALRLGAADYMLKPFAIDMMTHRLGMLCERRRMILEREQLQTQLMQADRLAALGTLAAGVVHEINNPLTYVVSNLDYLREGLDALKERFPQALAELTELEQVVRDTTQGAGQMGAVVKHIKTFARHEDPRRMRTSLTDLVEGALKMSTVLIRQRAKVKRDYGLVPDVEALDFQLAQVFINLLVNASQAIPEGDAMNHEVRVRLFTNAAGEAVAEVIDTGKGMGPDVRARLFEPFFTTKPAGVGTGVGLTICRNIIQAHGGRIEVDSTPGKGSTFRVVLPALGAAAIESAAAEPEATHKRGRVLVIDDDETLVASLRRCLEKEHEVQSDLNGRDALARIRAGARFDAILCDLSMPEITGNQLFQALQAELPAQAERVVFMTAGVLSPEMLEFAARVSDRLLEKPLELTRLRRAIQRLI